MSKRRIFDFEMAEQRVMILPEPREEKTASGIIIPNNAEDERPRIGKVVRVGSGDMDRPMKYKVGDMVMLSKFSGVEVEIDLHGEGFNIYLVTNQLDIMSKIWEVD